MNPKEDDLSDLDIGNLLLDESEAEGAKNQENIN